MDQDKVQTMPCLKIYVANNNNNNMKEINPNKTAFYHILSSGEKKGVKTKKKDNAE